MSNSQIHDAMVRAAKLSPQYRTFDLWRRVHPSEMVVLLSEYRLTVDWCERLRGTLRWDEASEEKPSLGGVGIVMLAGAGETIPTHLHDGMHWYEVTATEKRDALGLHLYVRVKRLDDAAAPDIRAGAP